MTSAKLLHTVGFPPENDIEKAAVLKSFSEETTAALMNLIIRANRRKS